MQVWFLWAHDVFKSTDGVKWSKMIYVLYVAFSATVTNKSSHSSPRDDSPASRLPVPPAADKDPTTYRVIEGVQVHHDEE